MEQEIIWNLADAYLHARSAKDSAEEALKGCNQIVEDIEYQLIECMAQDDLTSFKRDGVQFSLVSKTHLSPEVERKDELWANMKANGFEHLFSINSQTLSGEVKRLMEENNGQLPDWLDGLIRQHDKQ
jgi:hypothetical protein